MARTVGLSRRQQPDPLLKTVEGKPREKPPKFRDEIEDSPVSTEDEDSGQPPARFTDVTPDPVSDSSGSEDGGNVRANLKPTTFVTSSSTSQVRGKTQQSTAKLFNKATTRAASSQGAKRRRLNDEDGPEVKSSNKLSSPESSARTTSSKPPPSSNSSTHLENSQGFVKSRKERPMATFGSKSRPVRPYGTNGTAVQAKVMSRDSEAKGDTYKRWPINDDNIDTPRKETKYKHLDDSDASTTEGSPLKFNAGLSTKNLPEELQSTRQSFKAPPDILSPRPKKQSARIMSKEGRRGKPKEGMRENENKTTPKAIFKMNFDTQPLSPDIEGAVISEDHMSSPGDGIYEETEDELRQTLDAKDEEQLSRPAALCPWCGEPVEEQFLKDFSKGKRLDVRRQAKFCLKHKKHTAMETWRSKSYPTIDWDELPLRMASHHESLLDIVDGGESYYRTRLAEKIGAGEERAMKKEGNLNPGYYGPRGFNIMCDHLVEQFSDLLKEKAVKDRVISGRGSAAFIQSVLVAELATMLIMEDLGVPYEEARDIMEDSKAIGEMVNEET